MPVFPLLVLIAFHRFDKFCDINLSAAYLQNEVTNWDYCSICIMACILKNT